MNVSRSYVTQDYVIQKVTETFVCRVLWSEGRPCLEYANEEQLAEIEQYVRHEFDWELEDVFFTTLEKLPVEP
ncbi:hypothetical protein [Paenibacillus hunanensis]|uniref:Uncharacterized protein n=1 Tax=Paenibacillus hunanensis TaxID=539262 RepID=A0ABU1J098_9BACL|nr:hypothetical protein [Paenibacillus hunanensis]MDR6244929.1 hypothetical protein [Paenibacillus hunanensis]GGJ05194.1 hypothetical protein GCM10008022_12790 [Paenibacillus hunanensis]